MGLPYSTIKLDYARQAAADRVHPVLIESSRVTFRALIDCVMVMSACPQDVIRINAGRPVSAQYAVLDD